jgi:hypothetical protein
MLQRVARSRRKGVRARERARQTAATRRWRERVDAGKAVALVEYDAEIIEMTVQTAWLPECDAHDRAKVGAAFSRLLKDMARYLKKQ